MGLQPSGRTVEAKVLRCSGFAPEHGTSNLCAISFGKYKGKYSTQWIDCAHCHFNVAQPPCCLCVAGAGIQKKKTSKREICKISYSTSIRLGERMKKRSGCVKNEKDLSSEDLSILVQHRMLLGLWSQPVPRKEAGCEYIRICQSMTRPLKNGQWILHNRRWIMCTVCGRIKQCADVLLRWQGRGANRSHADCSRNGRS